MDAGLLDMLHDPGDEHGLLVGECVDINLDSVLQIAVDQHRAVAGNHDRLAHIALQPRHILDDLHRPSAEHIGRPDYDRKADVLGDALGLVERGCNAVPGLAQVDLAEQHLEPLAVFSQVDRIRCRAEDRDLGGFEGLGELQRRLAAELHDHAFDLAVALLDPDELDHVLFG